MKKYLLAYGGKSPVGMRGFEVVISSSILENMNWLPVDHDKHLNRFGFQISEQEVETFRCHVGLWQAFISSDEPFCLIVEDNINLSNEQIEEFGECICGIPCDWDIFFPYDRENNEARFDDIQILNPTSYEKYDYQPFLLGYEWGNSIYALTREGAYKLLSEIQLIAFRLDDTILELAGDKKAKVLLSVVDFFNITNYPKRGYFRREQLIEQAVLNFNLWDEEDEADLHLLLKSLSDIAIKCDIKLILQGGTHLGYVRHGGKMAWDDDVDLGIDVVDLHRLLEILDISNLKYESMIEYPKGIEYYKIWLHNGKKIEGHSYCFPFVDLWIYKVLGEDLVFENGIVCPRSANYPFKKIIFEESEFWLVGNPLEVLDSRYKDWRTKIRIYNWNHREENDNRHKLSCNINVDKKGRILGRERQVKTMESK